VGFTGVTDGTGTAAAWRLAISRRHLLLLARKGIGGAYALGTGTKRRIWVFRLSELAAAIATKEQTGTGHRTCERIYNPLRQSPLKRGTWLISEDH
jgi:hypothetical protein